MADYAKFWQNKTDSPNFALFSSKVVCIVYPYITMVTLDANNFTTTGCKLMIDISKESSGRALLGHIIFIRS